MVSYVCIEITIVQYRGYHRNTPQNDERGARLSRKVIKSPTEGTGIGWRPGGSGGNGAGSQEPGVGRPWERTQTVRGSAGDGEPAQSWPRNLVTVFSR